MTVQGWDPWKLTAIGVVFTVVTAVVTGVVVANWSDRGVGHKAETPAAAVR